MRRLIAAHPSSQALCSLSRKVYCRILGIRVHSERDSGRSWPILQFALDIHTQTTVDQLSDPSHHHVLHQYVSQLVFGATHQPQFIDVSYARARSEQLFLPSSDPDSYWTPCVCRAYLRCSLCEDPCFFEDGQEPSLGICDRVSPRTYCKPARRPDSVIQIQSCLRRVFVTGEVDEGLEVRQMLVVGLSAVHGLV